MLSRSPRAPVPRIAFRLGIATAVALLTALAGYQFLLKDRQASHAPPIVLVRNKRIDEAFRGRDELLAEWGEARPNDRIQRFPIPAEIAKQLNATIDGKSRIPDRHALYIKRPGLSHRVTFPEHPRGGWRVMANKLGIRGPMPRDAPARRILVAGDSHTEGACRLDERFTELLQASLNRKPGQNIEVVNAGVGGYGFYNYLGTFERLAYLEPDTMIVIVYGGNDFVGGIELFHFYAGTRPTPLTDSFKRRIQAGIEVSEVGLAQAFKQLVFLDEFPGERRNMLTMATNTTRELARQCEERGIQLILVYLPPLLDVQREFFEPYLSKIAAVMELDEEALKATDRLAGEWMRQVRESGIEIIDLRQDFSAATEPLYWTTDHHLNLAGHEWLARVLEAGLEVR